MYKQSLYNYRFEGDNGVFYYNSLSGELIKVDNETDDYLTNIHQNNNPEQSKYFHQVVQKGFLVFGCLDEFERVDILKNELLYSSNNEKSSYVIALTTECNYKCIYCYEEGCKKVSMSFETATQIVDFIKKQSLSNKMLKQINITWFGGEPLLNLNCINVIGKAISDFFFFYKYIYTTNIISNGYLLDNKTFDNLMIYNLKNVQITVDGDKHYYNMYKVPCDENALEKVLSNIVYVSKKCNIVVRLNCAKDNYDSIKSLCKSIINKEGVVINNLSFALSRIVSENQEFEIPLGDFSEYRIDFYRFLYSLGMRKMIKDYLPFPRTVPCGLMQKMNYVIDSDGFLYKCEHYVGKKEYSIGNVEYGVTYPEIYKKFITTPLKQECRNCYIFPICRGGCSQKRFVGEESVSCEKKKEEIKILLELLTKDVCG